VAKSGEFFPHVAVNDGAERGVNLAAEGPRVERGQLPFDGFADIPLGRVLRRIEGLDLELSDSVNGLVESEFPSETLGTRDFTDAAMLISFTIDFHIPTLPGVESVAIVSSMVLYGVGKLAETT
jgi:hypothetical protein